MAIATTKIIPPAVDVAALGVVSFALTVVVLDAVSLYSALLVVVVIVTVQVINVCFNH